MTKEVHVTPAKTHASRGARGQILPLFAGALLVIVLMVGLVIDSGFAFFGRRDAQNVADLAAVAGTQTVARLYKERPAADVAANPSSAVWATIDASVIANGCLVANGCTWTASYVDSAKAPVGSVSNDASALPVTARGVQVDVSRPTPTFIIGPAMSMLNQNPISVWAVQTKAIALTASGMTSAGAGQLLPIGMMDQDFQPGEKYVVTDAQLDAPGGFGWLSWSGSQAAPPLKDSVCDPDNPEFALPSWIENSSGVKGVGGASADSIRACLEYYMVNKIPVLVPVYDAVQGTGQVEYHIVGVMSMIITDLVWGPTIKGISGFFQNVYAYAPGSIPAGTGLQGAPLPDERFIYLGLVE